MLNFKWTITISHMIQVVLKKGQEHSTVMPGNANVDAGTKSDTTRPGSYDKGLIALCHCHHWHHHHHWNHLPVKPGQEVNFIHNFRRSVFVQIFQQSPGPKKIQKRVNGMVFLIKIQFHLPCTLLHNGQCTCICLSWLIFGQCCSQILSKQVFHTDFNISSLLSGETH